MGKRGLWCGWTDTEHRLYDSRKTLFLVALVCIIWLAHNHFYDQVVTFFNNSKTVLFTESFIHLI